MKSYSANFFHTRVDDGTPNTALYEKSFMPTHNGRTQPPSSVDGQTTNDCGIDTNGKKHLLDKLAGVVDRISTTFSR